MRYKYLLSFVSGLLLSCAFAPFNFWFAAIIAIGILFAQLQFTHSLKQSFLIGYIFALGFNGLSSLDWLYSAVLASTSSVTVGVVFSIVALLILSLFYAFTVLFYKLVSCKTRPVINILIFCSIFVLIEWLRTLSLTTFPHALGYAYIDTYLKSLAPILGVLGISFISVFISASCYYIIQFNKTSIICVITIFTILVSAYAVKDINWVKESGKINLAIIQANIPISQKWLPEYRQEIIKRYLAMTADEKEDYDLIVWPETAIPLVYHQAKELLDVIKQASKKQGFSFISGIVTQQGDDYYNSLIGINPFDTGEYIYHKYKLLPFGEYIPLKKYIEPIKKFLNITMSSFISGESRQPNFIFGKVKLAPSICYEDFFADYIRQSASASNILLTLTDDSWFGKYFGPYQHLEIARMRAVELGRYFIRAANTGISAIIDHKGAVLVRSKDIFVADIVAGEAQLMQGNTPYAIYSSYPILILISIIFCLRFLFWRQKKRYMFTNSEDF